MTPPAHGLRRWSAAVLAMLLLVPAAASAHPASTSAVLLDIGSERVTGEVQLPVDRLAVALARELTPAQAGGPLRAELERYTRSHIRATGADGRAWQVAVSGGRIERVDRVDHLVMDLSLTPPGEEVTDFTLGYEVIIEGLEEHRALLTLDGETAGVFDSNTTSLRFDGARSALRSVTTSAGLGIEHIAEGADHLLFLLMLLIPAPLVAAGRRWRPRDDMRRAVIRVVHVVTAFAIGHSVTLALAAFGVVELPSRLVESLIALSILVSAAHAVRPLIRGGEALIAGSFGLVHGLAFATLLGDLGLTGRDLVASLLGFNLGIEITQLLVVALMMPSLLVLSRTALYTPVRLAVAGLGALLAVGWLLERSGILDADPFEPVSSALVAQPFVVAAVFAVLAGVAFATRRRAIGGDA